ncbi:ABC transporter ATP-binding protein [Ferrimonas marina]|uniref:Tungstate transport system ATP-binding protein n=1 Tax=Ferrimonas marina TaxID=299255 RepID=A0A1M5XVD0_9GAMM|nr:energy-coupling factor ABC transporter ATP-binding protein [Ferrimonas marina]SHI03781.1 tungstate transport system ATP-binding protein [Ferrimonas marina]
MLLTATALEKRFEDRLLFRIPQLSVSAGEAIWLKGKNGTGKTTLLKTLSGLIKPSRGQVRLGDNKVELGQIVYLHQSPYLFDRTVIENLRFGLKHRRLTSVAKEERVRKALQLAHLEHLQDRPAQVLSGGERQRLALARAWVLDPQFLLLDEPTANLDPESIELITQMVIELNAQGCGVVLVSHQHTELTALCRQVWTLQDQQLHQPHQQDQCA